MMLKQMNAGNIFDTAKMFSMSSENWVWYLLAVHSACVSPSLMQWRSYGLGLFNE